MSRDKIKGVLGINANSKGPDWPVTLYKYEV